MDQAHVPRLNGTGCGDGDIGGSCLDFPAEVVFLSSAITGLNKRSHPVRRVLPLLAKGLFTDPYLLLLSH